MNDGTFAMELPTATATRSLGHISKPDLNVLIETSADDRFEIIDVDLNRTVIIVAISLR